MNQEVHFSSAITGQSQQDRWQTPPDIFAQLDAEFGFTLDAAAEHHTALCPYYFTEKEDALAQDWGQNIVFCNPPYSKLKLFAQKAREEAEKGALVVLLVPARTDTIAFHQYLAVGEIRFIKGRLKFLQNGLAQNTAPFPSMICILGPGISPSMKTVTRELVAGLGEHLI